MSFRRLRSSSTTSLLLENPATEGVRRLARRISSGRLRDKERPRPASAASLREAEEAGGGISEAEAERQRAGGEVRRPGSRLWRRRTASSPPARVAVVMEEEEEEVAVVAETTAAVEAGGEAGGEARGGARWLLPAAATVRRGREGVYDLQGLVDGEKVNELWFPAGDTLVYLCPIETAAAHNPAFRVSAATLRRKAEFFAAALAKRWQEHDTGLREVLREENAEYVLFFPPELQPGSVETQEEYGQFVAQMVGIRNFFAYLLSRPLVVLQNYSSVLGDLMGNLEVYVLPTARAPTLRAVESWIRSQQLDDPRVGVHRVIDLLIVSERYHWREIFFETFVHAAGQYDAISGMSEFSLLTPVTQLRLERESYAIKHRVSEVTASLRRWSFPILAASSRRSLTRAEPVRIPNAWKKAYVEFRRWTVEYYRAVFGVRSWPPHSFKRGMLLQIHSDFQALYELLVDNGNVDDSSDPYRQLLSRVLSDFERRLTAGGCEQVRDVPRPKLPELPQERSSSWNKRLSRDAISVVLLDSYNPANNEKAFVSKFKEFERSYGEGGTVTKSVEAREGRWCFVYAVVRTVGMVVGRGKGEADGGVNWEWGVEYWLCAKSPKVDWSDEDEEEEGGRERRREEMRTEERERAGRGEDGRAGRSIFG